MAQSSNCVNKQGEQNIFSLFWKPLGSPKAGPAQGSGAVLETRTQAAPGEAKLSSLRKVQGGKCCPLLQRATTHKKYRVKNNFEPPNSALTQLLSLVGQNRFIALCRFSQEAKNCPDTLAVKETHLTKFHIVLRKLTKCTNIKPRATSMCEMGKLCPLSLPTMQ